MYLLAVNFHYIADRQYPFPGIYPVSPQAFEGQLDALGRDFSFVSLAQIISAVEGRSALPKRACLITFDDGLREQYDQAWPVLCRKGIPAAFFVNTEPCLAHRVASVHQIHWLRAHLPPEAFHSEAETRARELRLPGPAQGPPKEVVSHQYHYDSPEQARIKYWLNFELGLSERDRLIGAMFAQHVPDEPDFASKLYMPVEQLQKLALAGCLGCHGHKHVPLAMMPDDDAREQLILAHKTLSQWTGIDPLAISYPYGGPSAVSPAAAKLAEEIGFRIGFTMERAFNRSLKQPLLFARADTNDVPGGKSPQFVWNTAQPELTNAFGSRRRQWFDEECSEASTTKDTTTGGTGD